jgi:hypothetical protein
MHVHVLQFRCLHDLARTDVNTAHHYTFLKKITSHLQSCIVLNTTFVFEVFLFDSLLYFLRTLAFVIRPRFHGA